MNRPRKIDILNIQNHSSVAMITYKVTYADRSYETIRANVRDLSTSAAYSTEPHVIRAECVGRVYVGWIKSDVRLLFLVTLSDSARSVDLVQEKEGTDVCRVLLEKSAEAKGNAEKSDVNTQGETLAKANEWSSVTKDMIFPLRYCRICIP